ncbi:hypothetical protein GQR58_026447 [Nymphon striatum]|nr:hypothetical protein GQR58_026447 [Nymphon striatum]
MERPHLMDGGHGYYLPYHAGEEHVERQSKCMQFEDTITVERSEDEIIKRKRKRIHYQDFVSGLESSDAGKKKQENVASTPKDSGVLSLPVPPKKVTCRTDYHTSQQLKPYSRSARSPHNKDRYSNPSQSRSRSNSGTHEQSPRHADDLYPAVKSLLLKLFLEAYILAHSVSGKASNGKNFAKPPFDSRLYGVMLSILKEKSLAHLQKI